MGGIKIPDAALDVICKQQLAGDGRWQRRAIGYKHGQDGGVGGAALLREFRVDEAVLVLK